MRPAGPSGTRITRIPSPAAIIRSERIRLPESVRIELRLRVRGAEPLR